MRKQIDTSGCVLTWNLEPHVSRGRARDVVDHDVHSGHTADSTRR